ncbi:MAG: hypothetical protein U1D31_00810 [Patescibacteria group bacterium]|nr:hypothetical protein [bacterium]MDZ4240662.1 hypothetical protein [Patescibacteria group bacterium]
MDPEDKRMLKKTLELAESNNKMLKKLHGDLVWRKIWSAVYWVFVLGLSLGLYYYLQPVLDSLTHTYQSLTGQVADINQLFDSVLKKR